MKRRYLTSTLAVCLLVIYAFLALGGCAPLRQKYYDAKQYFHTDVARW